MRVLLVNPPFTHKWPLKTFGFPVGFLSVGTFLMRDGVDVEYLDMRLQKNNVKELERILKKKLPDIVGITVTSHTIKTVLDISKLIKDVLPNCKIVLGGPHPTFMDKDIFSESNDVDVVVRHEGELTMLELVKAIEGGSDLKVVKGLTFRREDRILSTGEREFIEDLDSLPMINYDLLPDEIVKTHEISVSIQTSRGCPFNCVYCNIHCMWKGTYRTKSSEKIFKEIETLNKKYGVNDMVFSDDTFLMNKKVVHDLCDKMIEEGIDLKWGCSTRADTLSKDIIEKAYRAGCRTLYIGVESVNNDTLSLLNRKTCGPNTVSRAIKNAKGIGMKIWISFIIGLPNEGREDVLNTARFIRKLEPDFLDTNFLTPFPGTEIYRCPSKFNLKIKVRDWYFYDFDNPIVDNGKLTLKEQLSLENEVISMFKGSNSVIPFIEDEAEKSEYSRTVA